MQINISNRSPESTGTEVENGEMSSMSFEIPEVSRSPSSGRILFGIYTLTLWLITLVVFPIYCVGSLMKDRWRFRLQERFAFYDRGVRELAEKKPLWVHAASIGEVRAALPLLLALREKFEELPMVLTTTTPEGYRLAEKLAPVGRVLLFPLDFPGTVRRALRAIKPRSIVLLETEIWPNFLRIARRHGHSVVLVNGRISNKAFGRYRLFGIFLKQCLGNLRFAAMQAPLDRERLLSLGCSPERCAVLGNLKYDALSLPAPDIPDDLATILKNEKVLIAGSTHSTEEVLIGQAYLQLKKEFPDLKLIVAPRHLKRISEVERDIQNIGLTPIRRSKLNESVSLLPDQVIVLDTTGELAGIYGLGTAVFIGGSWVRRGGHNTLEPLSHGVPVFFGPYTHNFAEVTNVVLASGAGQCVKNPQELVQEVTRVLQNPGSHWKRISLAKEHIVSEQGAVENTVELLNPILKA